MEVSRESSDPSEAAPSGQRLVLPWILFSIGVAYATFVLFSFPKWTVDDAYITYRYASNLAQSGELTWNVGEDPIEGYTGVVLPVALAGAMKVGLDPDVTSKVIGVLAFFIGGLFLLLLQWRLGANHIIAAVVSILYFATPFMFTHATSGLETTLFTTLILADLLLLMRCLKASAGQNAGEIALSLALLLTCLTRPEGVVIAGLSVAALGFVTYRDQRSRLPQVFRNLTGCFVVPFTAYFLWRYRYYGYPFPNTYYAKARSTFQTKSLSSMAQFASSYLAIPATAIAAMLLLQLRPLLGQLRRFSIPVSRSATLAVASTGLVFVLVVAGQYTFSALRMNYSFRFFAPLFPVLLAIGGVLAGELYALLRSTITGRWAHALAVMILVAASSYQLFRNAEGLRNDIAFAAAQESLLAHEHIPAGTFLKEVVPASEWLVVVIDAGAVPYFSGLRTVDFGGINDEFLSKRRVTKLTKPVQADYFFANYPGAVVLTSYAADRVKNRRFMYLLRDQRFEDYLLVRVFANPNSTKYNLFVFLKRDIAELNGLKNLDEIWKPTDELKP